MRDDLPADIDLSPMHGQEVLSFVVGAHHVELVFNDSRLIVEAGFVIQAPNASPSTFGKNEMRAGSGLLQVILGEVVVNAQWSACKELLLTFSNKAKFLACVEHSGYESFFFSIPHESGVIVV